MNVSISDKDFQQALTGDPVVLGGNPTLLVGRVALGCWCAWGIFIACFFFIFQPVVPVNAKVTITAFILAFCGLPTYGAFRGVKRLTLNLTNRTCIRESGVTPFIKRVQGNLDGYGYIQGEYTTKKYPQEKGGSYTAYLCNLKLVPKELEEVHTISVTLNDNIHKRGHAESLSEKTGILLQTESIAPQTQSS